MSELEPIDPRLAEIECRLAAMGPCEARLNVAETIFRAGQVSVLHPSSRRRMVWPLVTAASVLVSVALAVTLARRPAERIVYAGQRETATGSPESKAPEVKPGPVRSEAIKNGVWLGDDRDPLWGGESNYIWARQLALRFGVESLPTTAMTVQREGNPPSWRYADWRRGLWQDDLTSNEHVPGPTADTPAARPDLGGDS